MTPRRLITAGIALLVAALPGAALAQGFPAQNVPLLDYAVDATGRVQITVASSIGDYFVLYLREDLESGADQPVSMTLGAEGTTTLTEQLAAYPQEHYRVARFDVAEPGDIDRDGIDDLTELASPGRLGPFNPAAAIDPVDGVVTINDRQAFEELSYQGPEVLIDAHLRDLEFVKFYLLDMHTASHKVYFMNTQTHRSHGEFARAIGLAGGGRPGRNQPGQIRGEIVYHPHVIGPNGAAGVYRFEFEPNDSYPFAEVARAYELIAKNFPLLRNDFAYYPMPNAALPRYRQEKALYDASRVAIILDEDILAELDYLPLNLAEGYGLLRVMGLDERPHPRDIVLYDALPNELSRVGGIITTVPQTPLSHVNLRAIQDGVPNAYIAGAREDPRIAGLIGKHVYYRVGQRDYEIREASLAEVEAHYADRRPAEPQVPARDLAARSIAPLDAIGFADWDKYGVKAANLAVLGSLGFPEGTVPRGYAVPFYFYDAFMQHNGFYERVRALLEDPAFQTDYRVQEAELAALRGAIEDAPMPQWMLDALAEMQAAFQAGMPLRCRSSTNNEDLPHFSGAGLYDSYTQHPEEGHIAKSIKQVYASLWNFRAFDERQFHRIDHLQTAMGVLVHPNYEGEQANGVGVTTDPLYETAGTYYLNTQLGEDLVTNPDALSIPEEILLSARADGGYTIVRRSNQVPGGRQLLSDAHLAQMRDHLGRIHAAFATLYGTRPGERFAMEIEYKVTAEGQLVIKQARPWVFEEAGGEPTAPSPTPPLPTPVSPTPPSPAPTSPEGFVAFLPLVVRATP
jgi:hypothetical protein